MLAVRRRFLILASGFAVIWLFLIVINLHSIDNTPEFVADEPVFKKGNLEGLKLNGAEVNEHRAKPIDPMPDHDLNDDKAFESEVSVNKSFPVNPKIANMVKEELKWGSKNIPDVNLTSLSVIKGPSEEIIQKKGYTDYEFNVLLSDKIGPRRKVPDSRHALCKEQVYSEVLPTATVIICYFNELPSVLMRLVNSILDRTPSDLINEVILVNDCSDPDKNAEPEVKQYAKDNWPDKIKFYKTVKNEGLIRAKMFGAGKATGEVLVFLDSHCEVNKNWLPPMLDRIKESPSRVVCPIIDIISAESMTYVASPVCMGGFNWALTFKWDYPSKSYLSDPINYIKPLKSPTMAGGLFAINRNFFYDIGQYDKGMDVWGAENVEISFRIWMCGGELEIVPCSRVGHIFRKRRPYGTNVDSMGKNSLRTALVWMDEYKDEFFKARPHLKHMKDYGDISEMVSLREKLQCKSFRWYLENIYPRILPGNYPAPDKSDNEFKKSNYSKKFLIRLNETNLCLTGEMTSGRLMKGARLFLEPCRKLRREQTWRLTENKELRPMGSSMLCLDSLKGVRLVKCHNQGAHQEWLQSSGKLYNAAAGKCLNAKSEIATIVDTEFCSVAKLWVLDPITMTRTS